MTEPTMHDAPADDAEFEGVLDAYRYAVYDYDYLTVIEEDEFNAIRRAVLDLHQRRIAEAKAEVLGELRAKLQKEIDWDMESYGASGKDWRGGVRLAIKQIDAMLNQKGGE